MPGSLKFWPRAAAWSLVLIVAFVWPHWTSAAAASAPAAAQFKHQFGPDFLDAYWRLHPDDAISVGYYRVAKRLIVPDMAARVQLAAFLRDSLARLHGIDAPSLDANLRTDWEVLDNQLQGELWRLNEYREWEWNPAEYNVAESFALLLNTDYAPLEERLRTVSARMERIPAYYAAARLNIRRPTREHTQLAIEQSAGVRGVFGKELEAQIAASKLAPGERQVLVRRIAAAKQAISGFATWLGDQDRRLAAGDARSFRLGRDLYERKFALDIGSGGTAEDLYRRALAEKERLLARMEMLADQLWPKYFPSRAPPADRLDKIGVLIGKLSEQHAAPADFVATVRQDIVTMNDWVTGHGLIALDPSKPLEVRVTPAYKRGIAGASVDAPGPYDPGARTYFNVTPLDELSPESAESYLREYNRWMLPILVIHEAVPGHYVQLLYANKSPSLIKSLFGNGAMIEGWAVYAERMMLESGFGNDTAEQWLIYYKWNLRSVCNTILDYSVHVLDMSEGDARKLLTREAFQSAEEVAGKWRRVSRTSVQLTQYFAGYSAIFELRERLKREQGEHFDLRGFHQTFLGFGSAPVRIIEMLMEHPAD